MTMKVLLCRRFKNSHDIQGASHTHKEEKKGKNTRKQKKNFNSIQFNSHTGSAREREKIRKENGRDTKSGGDQLGKLVV